MATIKFYLKGKKNPATIYVRFRDGRKIDLVTSTTLVVNPEFWNNEKGIVRQKSEFKDKLNFQNRLSELSSLIQVERNSAIAKNQPINHEWLDNIILSWKGLNTKKDSDLLVERMEHYKLNLNSKIRDGKIGVSAGTLRNYNTTMQRLGKFEVHKKQRFRLTDLDFNFHSQYINFAKSVLNLSANSIRKDIQQIKTVSLDAKDAGFRVNENVLSRNFNAPTEKTIFTTLSETELELLNEFDGPDYLVNAKDWLLIGCWTGCRVGDLMNLNVNNVINHASGKKMIQYTQSKTGKTVNVPLHPMVEEILVKRKGFPRPISDQKFNVYIKEVCKRKELNQVITGTKQNQKTHLKETGQFEKWQLIRSHTCRRSFATNHYSKLPNKLIMAVTGHSSEQMLMKYIGEVESDHVNDFYNLWNKENKIAEAI